MRNYDNLKMQFEDLDEFKKDAKKLSKRYKSLNDDIEVIKKVLRVNPSERPPFSFQINGLGISSCIIKVKKIACKSLKVKGVNTRLRIIYAHFIKKELQDLEKIVFIEIHHKNEQETEDKERIFGHFR